MKTGVKTALLSAGVLAAGVLVAVVVVAPGRFVLSVPHSTDHSHDQSDVVDTCQDSVRKQLKDPDSARFNDWTASAKDGSAYYYSASGMVNAKNGFGGYTGDQLYSCDATVTADGTVRAQARAG